MTYPSVLFLSNAEADAAQPQTDPPYFGDLNLDQVMAALTRGRAEYQLEPYFRSPLTTVEAIAYRHEVLRDLQDENLRGKVETFARRMRETRAQLAQADQRRHVRQAECWFLSACETYCDAVSALADDLTQSDHTSRGIAAVRDYLHTYTTTDAFAALVDQAREVENLLDQVRYTMLVGAGKVTVARYDGESDYGTEVAAAFEKFRQGEGSSYMVKFQSSADMNHVEAGVLDLVADLYPQPFAALRRYRQAHRDLLDPVVAAFDREVQFYLAHLEVCGRFEAAGLDLCFPQVTRESKELHGTAVFDIALADKLLDDQQLVVCNDFALAGAERLLVVSGPNQGGKTTLARTFGQMHHLAALGLTVAGTSAQLHLRDQTFTHFEREEDLSDLNGKLQDELTRMHAIVEQATADSVVIMNETFTSTTLHDALLLGTRVLEQLIDLDLVGLCVTFVDELASLGLATVSMVSAVDPRDHATRTFKVVRRPADGLAHALAIAEKYALTYEQLTRRIAT